MSVDELLLEPIWLTDSDEGEIDDTCWIEVTPATDTQRKARAVFERLIPGGAWWTSTYVLKATTREWMQPRDELTGEPQPHFLENTVRWWPCERDEAHAVEFWRMILCPLR